eukprot:CAMPEP_0118894414 /NCGR_PEP_ID=MMETSP1166-20130328/3202_1 /TAXON_ID=1104430 /ORGANISM="Chrysoreinhardia sp, Strain CCMP3193" /LENGTH=189 /DNA_ID=CAMNT_0006833321 /DNA_START=90 /DNA_END=659 /DNA_ORIENTATION=-
MTIFCLLVVSCAGFVVPFPKCQPRMYGRTLRATAPQSDEPSLNDPTTRELFGVVTRAELSVGLSDLRGDVRVLAEQVKASAEASAEQVKASVEASAEQVKASSEKQSSELRFVAFLGAVLGGIGYLDMSKDISELSDKVTKLVPEVEKFGKVATEFDLYKNGANIILAAIVGSVVTALVAYIFAYFKNE